MGNNGSLSNEVFEDEVDIMSISPSDTPSDWTLSPSGGEGKGSVSVEVFQGDEASVAEREERLKYVSSAGYLGEDMYRESECPSPASSIGGIYAVNNCFFLQKNECARMG